MSHHTQSSADISSDIAPVEKDYSSLVDKLYSCLNEHLMILMNQMLKTAGDRLFRLSEKAGSNERQMDYLDAIRLLNRESDTIKNQFFISLNESLSSQTSSAADNETSELSLVEQDEMEEMVAITTMHSQAMNLYGEEVNNLITRLEYLELYTDRIFDKDAVEPKQLCEVFKNTLEPLNLPITTRLIFFRLYNDTVNAKLVVLYESLNKLCINAGILPEIVLKTSKVEEFEEEEVENVSKVVRKPGDNFEEQHSSSTVAANSSYTGNGGASGEGNGSGTAGGGTAGGGRSGGSSGSGENQALYQKAQKVVSQFLNGDAVKQGPGIPESFSRLASETAADGKNYYQRKDVMRALSRLQHSLMQETEQVDLTTGEVYKSVTIQLIDTESIKRELIADIGSQNGGVVNKQVNVLDERSIDFVGMMFNAITEDESISKVISNLIMRLQIPVIKVAMLDQDLFTEEKHPAKNVLNLVSDAGKGVTTEEDRIYNELESIVNHVIETFDIDISIFEEAVEALEKLIDNETALLEETEKQQQRAIIQAHARDVVVSKLKILSSRKKLPEGVRPLVLKHWSTLMLNNYIRHGKESEQWLQSVLLLKLLLKCLQPVKEKKQYTLLKNNHQALVDAVNDGLYETRQDKSEIDQQVQSLKHLLMKRIDDYNYSMLQQQSEIDTAAADTSNIVDFQDKAEQKRSSSRQNLEEEKVFVELEEDESLDEEARQAQEKIDLAKEKIARLGSMARPGDWYEVYNGESKVVRRLKLSVILTESARLIFVDRRGVKVIEKDASDFIEEMETGQSRLIADHSAFDHALGKVIHALAA